MNTDIFEHIMKEHEEVSEMLTQLSSEGSGKQVIFDRLKLTLYAHVVAEEDSLYSAMVSSNKEFIDQAFREHAQINTLLREMDTSAGVDDPTFQDNVARLATMIQAHVQKEESQLIPMARDTMGSEEVAKLSQRFDEVDTRIIQKAR